MTICELYGTICPNEFKDVKLDIETIPNIESLNGKSPMTFSVLDADEYNLYEMSQNKKTFTGTTNDGNQGKSHTQQRRKTEGCHCPLSGTGQKFTENSPYRKWVNLRKCILFRKFSFCQRLY